MELSVYALYGTGFALLLADLYLLRVLLGELRRFAAARVLGLNGYIGDASEKLFPEKKESFKETQADDNDFLRSHAP